MIWVTRDLMPHDSGPPGGPVVFTRMLCFEFADGSGGSGVAGRPGMAATVVDDDYDRLERRGPWPYTGLRSKQETWCVGMAASPALRSSVTSERRQEANR